MSITDKIVEIQVNGSHLTRDSQNAGVQGEVNAAALRIAFDDGWDGVTKTITWWDARGGNEVKRLLTADQLEDITESSRVYLTPIPGEALTVAGKCRFAIDGYVAGQRRRSVYSELVVKPSGGGVSVVEEPTPSQAEQLQTQIDTLLEDLRHQAVTADNKAAEAAASAASAAELASAAASDARRAADSAGTAVTSGTAAGAAAETAETAAAGAAESRQAAQDHRMAADAAARKAEDAASGAAASEEASASAVVRAAACAERAEVAGESARSALSGVQTAIKSIPKGSTPIVNDLTTGGATMALSAEQGKVLGSRTVIHQYVGLAGIGLTDAEMSTEDFAANVAAILNALPNKAVVYLSENTANFCASLRARLNADLGMAIETAIPRMRLVRFGGNAAPAKLEAIIDSVVYKQIFVAHVDQASGRTELSPFAVAYDSSGFLLNSGGKLSGDLAIEKASPRLILTGTDATDVRLSILSGFAVLQARDSQDAAVSRQLRLYTAGKEGDLRHAAAFSSNESGASMIYSLLGVHNKPTGTYTGNSSAEVQEKDVGALGNLLLVWNNSLDVVSLVTPRGAICKSGANLSAIGYDECRYSDGVLYLATAAAALNQSGKSYSYRAI